LFDVQYPSAVNRLFPSVDAHVSLIKKGLGETDVLITTGGTSMGSTDLLKPVIERHLKGIIHFGRVSVKPGKPTTFASIVFEGQPKALFALPGNPASALVCFYLFVLPALRTMGGWAWSRAQLPRVAVKVSCRVQGPEEYFKAILV
jgi:gephyrin